VTKDFSASNLSVTNNGYLMQSTTISNPEIAFPMIKMIENDKIISTRMERDNTRAVYSGFNLDVITDQEQKEKLIYDCLNWIENKTSVKDENSSRKSFKITQNNEYIELINITNRVMTNVSLSMYNNIGIEILRKKIDYFDKYQICILEASSSLYTSAYYLLIDNNEIHELYPVNIIK
jgi:hypothetical protein